jgi:DNA-binding NarL/FixJ family response regulator
MKSYPIKTIYLVDDHESVIAGLKFVLEQNDNFKVIGGNTSVEIALAEIHSKKPHIAIIDYNLNGDTNGIELIKLIKRKRISTKCVLFSLRNDNELIFAAKEAGAQGYFSKGTPNKILRSKIEEIAFSDKLIFDDLNEGFKPLPIKTNELLDEFNFTPREIEMILLLFQGLSSMQIAKQLTKSYFTVSSMRKDINKKIRYKQFTNFMHFSSYAKSNNLFEGYQIP